MVVVVADDPLRGKVLRDIISHVNSYLILEREIENHSEVVVFLAGTFRKVIAVDVFEATEECVDVAHIFMANHQVIDMPSQSHLTSVYYFVRDAWIVGIDCESHLNQFRY